MLTRIAVAAILLATSATAAFAVPPRTVPEPSMLPMLASGVGGALLYLRSRRNKK